MSSQFISTAIRVDSTNDSTTISSISLEEDLKKLGQTSAFFVDAPLNEGPEESTFVLNSPNFLKLQTYVNAGIRLPNTEEEFAIAHPKDSIQPHLEKHNLPDLYEQIKHVCVRISGSCRSFQGETLGKIVDVGGIVSYFAQDAQEYISSGLIPCLKALCETSVDFSDPDTKGKVEIAIDYLEMLGQSATEHSFKCSQLQNNLIQFQTITKADKQTLDLAMNRLKESEPVLSTKVDRYTEESQNSLLKLDKQTKKIANEYVGSQIIKYGLLLGGWWIMPVSYCGYKILKHALISPLLKAARKQKEEMEKLLKETTDEKENIVRVLIVLQQYTAQLDPVKDSIGPAIEAMSGLISAFSEMKTGLDNIIRKLKNAQGRVSSESEGKRKIALRELEATLPTWEKVQKAASQFQQGGLSEFVDISKIEDISDTESATW